MLAISNEKQLNLRCLVCYIAPESESHRSDNSEQTTYLNCGESSQHHAFVSKNEYKAKSNTFHMRRNNDDFTTYCLELHRSTNTILLRQAGSNPIYNCQMISYAFDRKKELDLTALEYIHVTANTKDVSVRNLIVSLEKETNFECVVD